MARNEIKLRRQLLPGHIQRYRNYPALMKQYERSMRSKRYLRFFLYSLIVTIVVVLFLVVISYVVYRLEKERKQNPPEKSSSYVVSKCKVNS